MTDIMHRDNRLLADVRRAVDDIQLAGPGPELQAVHRNGRRRQRRWAALATGVVAVAATLTLVALPMEISRTGTYVTAGEGSDGPNSGSEAVGLESIGQKEFEQATDDVIAHAAHDSAYSAVAVDITTNEIKVYRVPGIDDAYGATYIDVVDGRAQLEVADALLTEKQAEVLVEQVASSVQELKDVGIVVTSWGPAPDGGPFRIGSLNPEVDAQVLLEKFDSFGEGTVSVSFEGELVPLLDD